jgi:hypothetical protein
MNDTLTLEAATMIVDYMGDDETGISIYEAYSGRGMYGETVVGFSANYDCRLEISEAIADLGLPRTIVPRRVDDLGLGVILY